MWLDEDLIDFFLYNVPFAEENSAPLETVANHLGFVWKTKSLDPQIHTSKNIMC